MATVYGIGLMEASGGWHFGEMAAQSKAGWAAEVANVEFPPCHLSPSDMRFYPDLEQLPFAALDGEGRVWGTLLSGGDGRPGFMECPSEEFLVINAALPPGDPLRACLREGKLFQGRRLSAGVGVMLHNGRRNKLEGNVAAADGFDGKCQKIVVAVTKSMGNCPKYVNVRHLAPVPAAPKTVFSAWHLPPGQPLPQPALDALAAADTVFLSTRFIHPSDPRESRLGMNHRGGPRGLVRAAFDAATGRTQVYLPDFSGNRLLQSLGNIEADGAAGLTVPIFALGRPTGLLYLTGDARNAYGAEAAALMPNVKAVTVLTVTGAVLIADALPLGPSAADAADPAQPSPYNPPLRFLAAERPPVAMAAAAVAAKLGGAAWHSPELATLKFRLSRPVTYAPGQFVILDCSQLFTLQYRHMAAAGQERLLNDDRVRSWTLSGAPAWRPAGGGGGEGSWAETRDVQITIRRTEGGTVTPLLFALAAAGRPIALRLVGVSGEFVLPPRSAPPPGLLFVVGGIGVTPLASNLRGLVAQGPDCQVADVHAIVAGRAEELPVLREIIAGAFAGVSPGGPPSPLRVRVHMISSTPAAMEAAPLPEAAAAAVDGGLLEFSYATHRLSPDSLSGGAGAALAIPDVASRWVYICGALPFEKVARAAAHAVGVPEDRVKSDSFAF